MLTKEQKKFLIDNYPTMPTKELAKVLGITENNLRRKASFYKLKKLGNYSVVDNKKECATCKELLPLEEFYKDCWNNSGYRYQCKKCYNAPSIIPKTIIKNDLNYRNIYGNCCNNNGKGAIEKVKNRPRNPVIIKDGLEGKVCNRCKEWKGLDAYSKDRKGIAGRKATCKECYKLMYI